MQPSSFSTGAAVFASPAAVSPPASPSPPPMAQNPPPPAPGNNPYGLATFQMSTGINITVSVVIAAALAVALIAGYIRIRRQRRAHRVRLGSAMSAGPPAALATADSCCSLILPVLNKLWVCRRTCARASR